VSFGDHCLQARGSEGAIHILMREAIPVLFPEIVLGPEDEAIGEPHYTTVIGVVD
jgi:hypothetical protein